MSDREYLTLINLNACATIFAVNMHNSDYEIRVRCAVLPADRLWFGTTKTSHAYNNTLHVYTIKVNTK